MRMTYRTIATALLAVVGWGALGNGRATADHCNGPFCNHAAYPRYYTLAGCLFGRCHAPLPVYQAAPWYLYWPYDAHFLTPAPVTGAFYGPPVTGNFPVNPYFPATGNGNGYGYGPIPGGRLPAPPAPPTPPAPPAPPPPPTSGPGSEGTGQPTPGGPIAPPPSARP